MPQTQKQHQAPAEAPSQPISNTVTWLHLSDFHFEGNGNWRQRLSLTKLLSDVISKLPAEGLTPDLVFLTGDVANCGKPHEYAQAQEFFHEIQQVLGGPTKANWFLCPGNHDVDRDYINDSNRYTRDTFSSKNADDLFGNPHTWETVTQRQIGFLDFTGLFLGRERQWTRFRPWATDFITVNGVKIAVCSFNSAFLSQDDNDKGRLMISAYQLENALQAAKNGDPDFVFALVHHPMDFLKDFDSQQLEQALTRKEGIHFLLRGHLHTAAASAIMTPSHCVFQFAAGAAYKNTPEGFSISVGRISTERQIVELHVWKFVTSGGGHWKRDEIYEGMKDGIWREPFPSQWGKEFVDSQPKKTPYLFNQIRNHLNEQGAHIEWIIPRGSANATNRERMNLEQTYIPLSTDWLEPEYRDRGSNSNADQRLSERPSNFGAKSQYHRRPASDLVLNSSQKRFIVAGDPGTGKTTFLRFEALELLSKAHPKHLPIYLPLRRFAEFLCQEKSADDGSLLIKWAKSEYFAYGLRELDSPHLQRVWLLDGLDEISEVRHRYRAASCIGRWLHNPSGTNDRALISARPHTSSDPEILRHLPFEQAHILSLDSSDREKFLEKWFFAIFGPDEESEWIQRTRSNLLLDLKKHPHVRELTNNPLLLSMVATVSQEGQRLPERRTTLYEKAVHSLLSRRYGPVAGGTGDWVRENMDGLKEAARWMMEEGKSREISDSDFVKSLMKGIHGTQSVDNETKRKLQGLAEELSEQSGILQRKENPLRYHFSHLGFQEYLTARAFSDFESPAKALEGHFEDSNWKETILFTVGHLLENGPSHLGLELLNHILNYRLEPEMKARRLTLALLGAAGAPSESLPSTFTENLKKEAINQIATPCFENEELIRSDLGTALGKLGDPRLDIKSDDYWVKFNPGSFTMGNDETENARPAHPVTITSPFKLGRFPVTNQQIEEFVECDGYQTRSFWDEEAWNWLHLSSGEFDDWFAQTGQPEALRKYCQPSSTPYFWHHERYSAENQPLVGINFYEARAYCRWLARLLKLPMDVITLPSEAEWEYAANCYARGDSQPNSDVNDKRLMGNYDNRLRKPTAVGLYPGNEAGLMAISDLVGNVWEWCEDTYCEDAYQRRSSMTLGPLETSRENHFRCVRGGSWFDEEEYLSRSFRGRAWEWHRGDALGFRLCIRNTDS